MLLMNEFYYVYILASETNESALQRNNAQP